MSDVKKKKEKNKKERKKMKIVKERIRWTKRRGRPKTTQQFKPL